MKLRGALAALTLVSLAAVADAAKTPSYAITKARVVTVSGAVLENATVVLRDGLVVDVGANVAIPKDARIFDGPGLTLTPGLIDAYSGAGLPAARPAGGPGGGGGGAGPATPPANPIDPASNIHERVRASEALKTRDSGITTIVPISREGLVFGAAPVMNLNGDKPGTMVGKASVGLAANLTTLGQRYPGSLMGAMTFFRQALMDGAHHRADVAAYEKAPSIGRACARRRWRCCPPPRPAPSPACRGGCRCSGCRHWRRRSSSSWPRWDGTWNCAGITSIPGSGWWADIRSEVERARLRARGHAVGEDDEAESAHPLLASWGRVGRDFLHSLYGEQAFAVHEGAEPAPPAPRSLAGMVAARPVDGTPRAGAAGAGGGRGIVAAACLRQRPFVIGVF